MKKLTVSLLILGFAGTALALDRAELDQRVRKLTAKFDVLQSKPDRRVPAETLRQAKGIILMDCTKGGLVVGFENGYGVALVNNPQTRQWSAPAFLQSNQGSIGAQIGGQESFLVILLMNDEATRQLGQSRTDFGGEARGTAGDDSGGTEGVLSSGQPWVLVYADRAGLYGGATIKGGAVAPDDKANWLYYGSTVTVNDIVIDQKVQPTEAGRALANRITEWANRSDQNVPASAER
jgi:lipid-binding SYLF domain-containing protein